MYKQSIMHERTLSVILLEAVPTCVVDSMNIPGWGDVYLRLRLIYVDYLISFSAGHLSL